jgi:hypothetical protein
MGQDVDNCPDGTNEPSVWKYQDQHYSNVTVKHLYLKPNSEFQDTTGRRHLKISS